MLRSSSDHRSQPRAPSRSLRVCRRRVPASVSQPRPGRGSPRQAQSPSSRPPGAACCRTVAPRVLRARVHRPVNVVMAQVPRFTRHDHFAAPRTHREPSIDKNFRLPAGPLMRHTVPPSCRPTPTSHQKDLRAHFKRLRKTTLTCTSDDITPPPAHPRTPEPSAPPPAATPKQSTRSPPPPSAHQRDDRTPAQPPEPSQQAASPHEPAEQPACPPSSNNPPRTAHSHATTASSETPTPRPQPPPGALDRHASQRATARAHAPHETHTNTAVPTTPDRHSTSPTNTEAHAATTSHRPNRQQHEPSPTTPPAPDTAPTTHATPQPGGQEHQTVSSRGGIF